MSSAHTKPNSLIHASSPYLLQHAYNPVDWREWNPDNLALAQRNQHLLIISIGYAACHWCHVMEHESFEDETVARHMNQHYISIKVDREERPDIDAIYMNAAQITTGRGGWPLNVIALPDGRPVFAGTYFPKDTWIKILNHFAPLWQTRPQELEEVATRIHEGLYAMENGLFKTEDTGANILDKSILHQITTSVYEQLDHRKGGLDKAPKFPMPVIFDYLLEYQQVFPNEKILSDIHATLVHMREGGIYDQAGGGFARYSVDEYWFVPHFEKMLYDNGQLLSLYAKAYASTGVPLYKDTVTETIQWIQREMTDVSGLFYSSLDADSEGVEGKFYCFTKAEIETIVPERADVFCAYFSIEEEGNWEHSNILYIGKTIAEICAQFSITRNDFARILEQGKQALMQAREKRIRPALDDKCITSWNALTISGLAAAHKFTGNIQALGMARAAMDALQKHAGNNGHLWRIYKAGKSSIDAFLDDYVFTIQACIDLYTSTWEEKYLLWARDLTHTCINEFYQPQKGVFYYTGHRHESHIVRTIEMTDNVIPASNSAMAMVLFQMGHYFAQDEWINISLKMCQLVKKDVLKFAPYHSGWARCMLAHTTGGIEVALTGPLPLAMHELYIQPGLILMHRQAQDTALPLLADKPLSHTLQVFICRNKTCGLPVSSWTDAIHQIKDMQPSTD